MLLSAGSAVGRQGLQAQRLQPPKEGALMNAEGAGRGQPAAPVAIEGRADCLSLDQPA